MAAIRKRNGKWQVQVRRQGAAALSRTFAARRDAEIWARQAEAAIDRGDLVAPRSKLKATLGDLLERYRSEVTPRKRSARTESPRIGLILRHPIAKIAIASLKPEAIAAFRDERLAIRSSETVRQDLVLLSQVLKTARREWGLPMTCNPVEGVQKPKSGAPRTRRLAPDEFVALNGMRVRNPNLLQVFRFALATGMRRGEILRARWGEFNREDSLLHIPVTKNGRPRLIPLSPEALSVLASQPCGFRRSRPGIMG